MSHKSAVKLPLQLISSAWCDFWMLLKKKKANTKNKPCTAKSVCSTMSVLCTSALKVSHGDAWVTCRCLSSISSATWISWLSRTRCMSLCRGVSPVSFCLNSHRLVPGSLKLLNLRPNMHRTGRRWPQGRESGTCLSKSKTALSQRCDPSLVDSCSCETCVS